MKVRTKVRAGEGQADSILMNHNGVRLKTKVRAGYNDPPPAMNHSGVRVKTKAR